MNTMAEPSDLADVLRGADAFSREHLMREAVARGCRHYAPLLAPDSAPAAASDLPHEVLGVALLRGPQDVDTFQAIRCGAMVLSDLKNDPSSVRTAAEHFGVTHRVAHVARLGLANDTHPGHWATLLSMLPGDTREDGFLPGLSRLTFETWVHPLSSRKLVRTWLRTAWAR